MVSIITWFRIHETLEHWILNQIQNDNLHKIEFLNQTQIMKISRKERTLIMLILVLFFIKEEFVG
jgi:hypothetical protein